MANTRTTARLFTVCSIALYGAACGGVTEHPHDDQAKLDPSDDFGPSPGTSGGTPATGSGAAPGISGSTSTAAGGAPSASGGTPSTSAGSSSVAGTASTTPGSGGSGGSGGSAPSTSGGMPSTSGGTPSTSGGTSGVAGGATTGGTPAVSGASLPLGGVDVPKENVIAFIHIGHSNMAGRASSPTASRAYHRTDVDPMAWMYQVGNMPKPALEPFTADWKNTRETVAGPGTSLLKQAAAMSPGKYFLSLGFGKGSAYCSQFLPGALYYDTFIAAPKAVKGRVTFGAILIMLGITERHGSAADTTGYPDCINKLVTAIRTDVGEPNLPLLITDYEQEASGEFALTGDVAKAIGPQIKKIPTVVSNSALVPTDKIAMQDDHHFNLDGQKEWTRRALEIMKTKGWAPWATK